MIERQFSDKQRAIISPKAVEADTAQVPEPVAPSQLLVVRYSSPEDAVQTYRALPEEVRGGMAQVYQEAFGGPPWFERFKCGPCGDFYAEAGCCPGCQSDLTPAYPREDLEETVFPKAFGNFTPGAMVAAQGLKGEVQGFMIGGMVSVKDLVRIKYKSDERIGASIMSSGNLQEDKQVFYVSEICVDPRIQKAGIGARLSDRLNQFAIAELGADVICGRTINMPWLGLRERQLRAQGYDFGAFVPDGDTFEMSGVRRQFYIGKRSS